MIAIILIILGTPEPCKIWFASPSAR